MCENTLISGKSFVVEIENVYENVTVKLSKLKDWGKFVLWLKKKSAFPVREAGHRGLPFLMILTISRNLSVTVFEKVFYYTL